MYNHIEICLFNRGSPWPNGSYFLNNNLHDNSISCVHSALNGGGWVLPNGSPCTSDTSPIQCTTTTSDCSTNITLRRVNSFKKKELVYKCCSPNDCSDNVIIAKIYG